MAFAGSLTDLQAEASCPICFDYLNDPVTTNCGHNFCHSCINQCWAELQGAFPCPVCLQQCPNRFFKRNTQLCSMLDIVKQLPTTRSKKKTQEKKSLCEKHHQVLDMFCDKDLELLCPQCRISCNHQEHHLLPIEQAAASHRRKLKSYTESLMKQFGDAENGFDLAVSKQMELKHKVENQRRKLYSEFEQCINYLGKEQEANYVKLFNEEEDIIKQLAENKIQISDHTSTLTNLLTEITEKCMQPDLDLLTGIRSIHNRYEHRKHPGVFAYELKRECCSLPPQYFGLQNMISTFQVNLTLDPESAHEDLTITENRKTVMYTMRNPSSHHHPKEYILHLSVMSTEGFKSGRHFWQVQATGTGEWAVGVCEEYFPINAMTSPPSNNDCCQTQLWFSEFSTWESVNCRWIGVFLDYELGELSFYNLNNRSHLHTFTVTSKEKLIPYFCIGPSCNSLAISIVIDE
ncbi:PREDICTED: putative tripartite motif-containing protein 75-like [Chrysochloris asiatica]|uniref:Tripartite motif-containing protein 75-like n=1 Tax=Chrysochloris asiatica TaxID=185453 RepID=A0A9B0WRJ2_CHRAS|nr:PREDICTED: putative tripartite motif-containing protein 75-like [Chrysochloris asiatica]